MLSLLSIAMTHTALPPSLAGAAGRALEEGESLTGTGSAFGDGLRGGSTELCGGMHANNERESKSYGFAVKRHPRASDTAVGVLDDGLNIEGIAHSFPFHGYDRWHTGGGAAAAGVAMAVLESEALWALEEGRGHSGCHPRVYSEKPVGTLKRLHPGDRLVADVGVSTSEAARLSEAEAVAETVEAARAEAAEEAKEALEAERAEEAKEAVQLAGWGQHSVTAEAARAAAATSADTPAVVGTSTEEVEEEDAEDAATAEEENIAPEVEDDASDGTSSVSNADGSTAAAPPDSSSGDDADWTPAAASASSASSAVSSPLFSRVVELKRAARACSIDGDWQRALDGYLSACTALSEESVQGPESDAGVGGDVSAAALAKELQSCRLNAGLCALQTEQWSEAIRVCGDALRANPRCATAHHRRVRS